MSDSETAGSGPVAIRRMQQEDEAGVLTLLSRSLGWFEDERHRGLLSWKHKLNPFGPSPGWIAEDDTGLLGFRTMMRWQFVGGGGPVPAVRAVDTATDPRARGRGIFRNLTLRAVEDLTAEGVACVFNTPNAQSAPGYLSMGWRRMGRLPVSFRPMSLSGIPNLISARGLAGDLWSKAVSVGEPASSVLADRKAVEGLLTACEPAAERDGHIRTWRTPEFLQWRYAQSPVGYRAWLVGKDLEDGVVIFRARQRGAATELVIVELLIPPRGRRLQVGGTIGLGSVLRACEADYGVSLGVSRPRFWAPLPGKGPLLTWRALNWPGAPPVLNDWNLSTGDIELF